MVDFLIEMIASVAAGVAVHYICKWLDRDRSDSLD